MDPPARRGNVAIDKMVVDHIRDLTGKPKPKLINLSFFGINEEEGNEAGLQAIRGALNELFEKNDDVLVITAAGNSGTSAHVWPAHFSHDFPHRVIAVGALDETVYENGRPLKASFSNWWTGMDAGIDAYASGVRVLGPSVTGDYLDAEGPWQAKFTGWSRWSGTSFAAATVTGMLAQVMITQHVTGPAAWNALVAAHGTQTFKPIPGLASCPEVPYFSGGPPVTRQEDAG